MLRFLVSFLLCFYVVVALFLSAVTVAEVITCSGIVPMRYRYDKVSITDFGGVGDGRTLNTKAFREAIFRIQHLKRRGGTLLYIPPGVYLTESFNLTSHMTLYLAKDAVIKATQVLILISSTLLFKLLFFLFMIMNMIFPVMLSVLKLRQIEYWDLVITLVMEKGKHYYLSF